MKKLRMLWRWALLPLFALCAAAILGILNTYTHTNQDPLPLTPIFQDARGWEIYTLTDGVRTDFPPQELLDVEIGETFYLTRLLTKELEAKGYTFFTLDSKRPCSVFLNGELLYTTCPDAAQAIGQVRFPTGYTGLPQGGESIRFTLPSGFAGKTLTIATTHPVSNYSKSMPSIIFSNQAMEAEYWMAAANHSAMPASAFAVAALLLLGLLFFSLFGGGLDLSLLLLSAAALAQFFYYLREYSFSSVTSTALNTPWAVFLPHLIVILPELYLTALMKRRRKRCAVLVLAAAGISLIPVIANRDGVSFLTTPFLPALYVGLLALLVYAVLEARDGNRVFRIVLGGLGAIFACIAMLGLFSAVGNGYYSRYLMTMLLHPWDNFILLLYWCGTILFVLSCVIGVYVLVHNTADTQTKLALQAERLDQLNHNISVQKQFYETKLTNEEELRALRHDMRAHLATLAALLSDGKTAEAGQYLNSLEKQHQERPTEVFCGDPYMNTVLGLFAAQFRKNKIAFTCRCSVEGWALPGMEVCLILNNALENALEASRLLPVEERTVKLQAAVRKKQLLFRISNRFYGTLQTKTGLPSTTKTEKGHGYGLQNIRTTAEQLGGEMMYRIEEDCFILDVRLPLPEDAEKGDPDYVV